MWGGEAGKRGDGLLAPQRVPGGYSIIQVLVKQPGVQLEYDAAKKTVLDDYTTVQMDHFIDGLKLKHRDQIHLDSVYFAR